MAIQTQRQTARFKDFYTNLDAHPIRKTLYILEDADAVKTAIKNIVFTNSNERFFNPEFGAGIPRTLFENITPATEMELQELVKVAIRNYEPRVDLLDVVVVARPDQNAYSITIFFSMVNNPTTQTFNVILNRVR